MADVRLQQVTKRFGEVAALQRLDLEVRDQEFFTILGPSGCGKSTVLNLIAGLDEPTEGDIFVGDRRVNGLPPQQRNVAMVFQSYALYPHKSVFENIAFPLRMQRRPEAEIRRRVERTAASFQLSELQERLPRQLSGGQRQRVALARAIVRQPVLYLMDEPLANLDAKMRAETRLELKRLHRELRTTTLYVTHDQIEAMSLSDRIAILKGGVVQQVGAPHEVYHTPANLFVARFIGSPAMNQLEIRTGDDGRLLLGEPRQPLPWMTPPGPVRAGERLILGLRPHDARVVCGGAGEGVRGSVLFVETLGHETFVTVELAGMRCTGLAQAPFTAQPGDPCSVDLPADKAHFFNAESGERLS